MDFQVNESSITKESIGATMMQCPVKQIRRVIDDNVYGVAGDSRLSTANIR